MVSDIKTDILPDMQKLNVDRSESVTLMSPVTIDSGVREREMLVDLAMDLVAKSSSFKSSLPAEISTALADLVRSMNCYYSNLIEGHDTHPVDIERALHNDFSSNPKQRDLQLEAKAHIAVQQWIDGGGIKGHIMTREGLCEIHKRFIELLPDELRTVQFEQEDGNEVVEVVPGELRSRDVRVGRHIAISPGAVPRFLDRFTEAFHEKSRTETLLSIAAAHHRFNWIHPFVDGNGRVARLMSHAVLLETLDSGGVWSIARGLARNESGYKQGLANCDLSRRNALDGRGNLSQEALVHFTRFFLQTCIDQVSFMESLVQPTQLRRRILRWVDDEVEDGKLLPKSGQVLEAILYRGELPKSELQNLLGVGERQVRRILSGLYDCDVIYSETNRSPLRLSFPAKLAHLWMPGLFPERAA